MGALLELFTGHKRDVQRHLTERSLFTGGPTKPVGPAKLIHILRGDAGLKLVDHERKLAQ
jgi:hypothetical protein